MGDLGLAALDDLLDRGDLSDWAPLAKAITADPYGTLADSVMRLCAAHPIYGTSALWRSLITKLRSTAPPERSMPVGLSELRVSRGLTQAELAKRMGISQSDISKLERRTDVRMSTVQSYVSALGGKLRVAGRFPDGTESDIAIGG
ncbi:hypothetical protein BH23ACT12_BH23ACT12_10830 [soil metagenome]